MYSTEYEIIFLLIIQTWYTIRHIVGAFTSIWSITVNTLCIHVITRIDTLKTLIYIWKKQQILFLKKNCSQNIKSVTIWVTSRKGTSHIRWVTVMHLRGRVEPTLCPEIWLNNNQIWLVSCGALRKTDFSVFMQCQV